MAAVRLPVAIPGEKFAGSGGQHWPFATGTGGHEKDRLLKITDFYPGFDVCLAARLIRSARITGEGEHG
jgi:hypothetical protein